MSTYKTTFSIPKDAFGDVSIALGAKNIIEADFTFAPGKKESKPTPGNYGTMFGWDCTALGNLNYE